MKKGEYITARTHAEFLNEAFGTNYKAWMKCTWQYGEWTVWMVRFNKDDGGWKNTFIPANRIKEENLQNTNIDYLKKIDKKKIVFEIIGDGTQRKYVFKGKYVYDEKESEPLKVRYYNMVSDELFV